MLDNRIYTFLKLCEVMNYKETANQLSMTQPAVTQHIQSLERQYNCKLFIYEKRTLSITKEGKKFQKICQSAYYEHIAFKKYLAQPKEIYIRIGATKTIGDYVICNKVAKAMKDNKVKIDVYVDNTEKLLEMVDKSQVDFGIVEGYFEKEKYGYELMKKEEFLGICSKEHRFAGKSVNIEEILEEKLYIREIGSGTRYYFEDMLFNNNYSIGSFKDIFNISSFHIIKNCLKECGGITFGYKTIADTNENLEVFRINDENIFHEFNYVYLKNKIAKKQIELFKKM